MKRYIKLISVFYLVILSGCFELNKKIPKFNDFKYIETNAYMFDKTNNLKLNIDSCLSIVEINTTEDKQIKIDIAYNQTKTKYDLNFVFKNNSLDIKDINTDLKFCNDTSKINSFIKISLPNSYFHLDINTNTFLSNFHSISLNVDKLNYIANNGNFKINSAKINTLYIEQDDGNVFINNLIGDKANLYVTNGNFEIKNSNLLDILLIKLRIGDIILNNVETNIVDTDIELGNTYFEYLYINEKINVLNTHGSIKIKNAYCEKVYLDVSNGNIEYFNEDLLFFIDTLQYSVIDGDVSFNVNANIIKI